MAAGAVSLVGHAVVLVWLALSILPLVDGPPVVEPPDIQLRLEPPPSSEAAPGTRSAHPAAAEVAPASLPTYTRRSAQAARPAAAATAVTAALGPPAPAKPSGEGRPAQGSGLGDGAALAGLIRSALSCRSLDSTHQLAEEKARCAAKLAQAGRTAPAVDSIPAEKRAYYDQVAAARASLHGGAPLPIDPGPDNLGIKARWAAPDAARAPGFGCAIPLGRPRGWKSYHDRPPHSLKLGPLPCFITPPVGFGTEEAAIQAPPSHREQTDDAAHSADLEVPKP